MSGRGIDAGRKALETLDKVLAQRPEKDDHALSDATAQLCLFRDALIEAAGPGGAEARERLSHANAILSVVAAMHFPLGKPPWEELEKARGWLADLLAKSPAQAG
jgi:hypothetical protein